MRVYQEFSYEVYNVEKGVVKTGDLLDDDNYLVLDTIDTNIDTISDEIEPKENSMQAMAVAEIKDKYKGIEIDELEGLPGYPESVIEKDIVVAYAGTTPLDLQDWDTNINEIRKNNKHADGAFHSALSYADEIEKNFPPEDGYKITPTGHSLGGAEAIFVAVMMGYDYAYTFAAGGPGLTDSQIEKHQGEIINIYDMRDMVTSGILAYGKHELPFNSIGIENSGFSVGFHSMDLFDIDNHGNYVNKYGDIVVYTDFQGGVSIEQTLLAQKIQDNKNFVRQMEINGYGTLAEREYIEKLEAENRWLEIQIKEFSSLVELRNKLGASGGGLSFNEEIYLENHQALIVVKLVSSKFDESMEKVLVIYRDGLNDIEQIWTQGVSDAIGRAPDLSYGEIMDAMMGVGCTKQGIVDKPSEAFNGKIAKVNQISSKFSSLTEEISSKINELVERDEELAAQIS